MSDYPALNEVLSVSPAEARRRLRFAYDTIPDAQSRLLVLFGCGPLGRDTSAALARANRPAVAFSDNDPTTWEKIINGTPVLSPDDSLVLYGESAIFVVTIYNGATARDQLKKRGCRHVIHFSALYYSMPDALMPWYALDDPAKILDAGFMVADSAGIWADEASRTEYVNQITWRLGCDIPMLSTHDVASECYFPPDLFALAEDSVIVDCGAFDGDSLRLLLSQQSIFGAFIGVEPDPESYKRLSQFVGTLPLATKQTVTIFQNAVGAAEGKLTFQSGGEVNSNLSLDGNTVVDVTTLDSLMRGTNPDYIKMDIEGAELDALTGTKETLVRDKPVLAISIYHRSSDLWTIPNLIKSMVPEYDLYLRRYAEDCWELICYAIHPSHKLKVVMGR